MKVGDSPLGTKSSGSWFVMGGSSLVAVSKGLQGPNSGCMGTTALALSERWVMLKVPGDFGDTLVPAVAAGTRQEAGATAETALGAARLVVDDPVGSAT